MRKHLFLASALTLASLAGCGTQPQTSDQLNDRLTNATQITDAPQHDATCSQIANDAASSGQSTACMNAIDAIKDRDKRDRTAHDCADTFNNKGDRQTAEMVVQKISDPNLKDQILQAYGRAPAPKPM